MIKFKEWLKIQEMGSGPYIGNCTDTDDYQVVGACSDQNSEELNKKYRNSGVDHKKVKKHSDKIRIGGMYKAMKTFREFVATQPEPASVSAQPVAKQQKWKASKEEIIGFWKNLRPDVPIAITPIDYQHKGSTYDEDGLRLTGSPQFISSVLGRLKEFLNFETPSTKLALSYRQTESPSKSAIGDTKTSYVFYLQAKQRGLGQ